MLCLLKDLKRYTLQIAIIIYIIHIFRSFFARNKVEKLSAYAGLCETVTIHHMSDFDSNKEEGLFFKLCLGWKMI